MLMPSLDTSIANVALPTLAVAFGASFQGVQWIVLSYLVAVTALIVSAGHLGDLVGRRRLLLAGIVLFTAASLACGIAPTLLLLIAARVAQGLGAAVMLALTMAMVGDAIPTEHAGSAMGLLGTMSAIGTTLGPSLGGILIAAFGWRTIFLVNVPLGILNLILAHRYLPVDRPASKTGRTGRDHLGTLLLVLRVTTRRSPAFGAGLAMSVLVSTVIMSTLVIGPFYLSRALGLKTALVGLVMSAGPLVAALSGVPGGWLVDHHGAARMTVFGLTMMLAGCVALSLAPASLGIAGYLAPIVLMTTGYAVFQAANNTAVMTAVGPDRRGIAAGLLSLSRNVGLISGASAMGAVFAFATSASNMASARPVAVAVGMRTTFAVAAVLSAGALVIAIRALPLLNLTKTT